MLAEKLGIMGAAARNITVVRNVLVDEFECRAREARGFEVVGRAVAANHPAGRIHTVGRYVGSKKLLWSSRLPKDSLKNKGLSCVIASFGFPWPLDRSQATYRTNLIE